MDFSFGRAHALNLLSQVSLHCKKLLTQRLVSPLLYQLSYLAPFVHPSDGESDRVSCLWRPSQSGELYVESPARPTASRQLGAGLPEFGHQAKRYRDQRMASVYLTAFQVKSLYQTTELRSALRISSSRFN